eukprot:s186_g12.t1
MSPLRSFCFNAPAIRIRSNVAMFFRPNGAAIIAFLQGTAVRERFAFGWTGAAQTACPANVRSRWMSQHVINTLRSYEVYTEIGHSLRGSQELPVAMPWPFQCWPVGPKGFQPSWIGTKLGGVCDGPTRVAHVAMAKLYREAGRVVDDVVSGRCGLKAALYAQNLEKPRAVCKLASAALSNQQALCSALRKAQLEETGIFLVMAFELLAGSGKIRGGGQLRRRLEKKLKILRQGFKDAGGQAEEPSAFAQLPRYVRINSLRCEAAGALQRLSKALKDAYQKDLAAGRKVAEETAEVSRDELVPELLVLHPSAKPWLQQLPEVETGALVLQDRSSCLSALAAGLITGTIVLDACAAPGSKTSHAIELMGGSGKMFAFEKDPRRGKSLLQRLRLLCGFEETTRRPRGAKGKKASVKRGRCLAVAGHPGVEVEVRIKDFLEVKPWEAPWNQVEVLLVDPSCSGSGLPEHHLSAAADASAARLKRLAAFQRRILQHAMKFPKARTVVYSTCSLHRLENEDVVEAALNVGRGAFQVTKVLPWWRNAPRNAEEGASAEEPEAPLPSWAHLCLRSEPGFHRCRGFFLCRLDRVDGVAGVGPTAEEQLTPRKRRKRKLAELKKSQRATEAAFQVPPAASPAKKRKGKAASGLRISVVALRKTQGVPLIECGAMKRMRSLAQSPLVVGPSAPGRASSACVWRLGGAFVDTLELVVPRNQDGGVKGVGVQNHRRPKDLGLEKADGSFRFPAFLELGSTAGADGFDLRSKISSCK